RRRQEPGRRAALEARGRQRGRVHEKLLARRPEAARIATCERSAEAGGQGGCPDDPPLHNREEEMKRLVLACLLLGLATGTRGDDPQPKDKMGGDPPGAEHKALTKLVGEYTTATTMNMGGPPQ